MLDNRLDKLNKERNLIKSGTQSSINNQYYINKLNELNNFELLSNPFSQFSYPYSYQNPIINPIYVDTPYYIQPIILPTIETIRPLKKYYYPDDNYYKYNDNSKLPYISYKSTQKNKYETPEEEKLIEEKKSSVKDESDKKSEYESNKNKSEEEKKEEESEDKSEEEREDKNDDKEKSEQEVIKIIETKQIIQPIQNKNSIKQINKNKWWNLLRDFVFLYKFILTSKKYVRYALKRNRYIKDRYNSLENDIEILKEWIIDIEKPFIDIFQKYERVNIRFRNNDSEIKINKKSEQLYKLIKIFMENLIGNTKKLSDIPQEIQNILYEYIREKGYYARKYLTSFQYNRLDFDFYGRTRYMNDKRGGLILAFLIISGITVQQILLHLHELFPKYNNNPYIISNCKYIGSLLHFLTRDTFKNNPQIQNDGLSLINYYRNYHINDDEVKNQKKFYPNYKIFKDKDQFAQFLVSESKITPVWEINPSFVETYKKFIFEWAVNLSKILRIKHSHHESTMKNKRKSSRSPYK